MSEVDWKYIEIEKYRSLEARHKKLLDAFKEIAVKEIGPPYEFSCEEMQDKAREAITEDEKASEE